MRTLLTQIALGSLLALAGVIAMGSAASAQEEPTTTQLDIGGDESGETTTTQLDIGGDQATTGTETPPNRVDAGAGGTSGGVTTPLALVALAGGLIVVTTAAARKVRAERS